MNRRAFTLIELAIVLAIVGILIGGSFKVLKSQMQKTDILKAKEHVQTSKDAIIGYAMEYIDLPTWEEFDSNLSTINAPDSNKTFFYFAAPELQNDIDICTFHETSLEVRVYEGSTLSKTIPNIAFVVASESANRNIQTNYSQSGSTYFVKIYRGATQADDNSADYTDTSETYDDIVRYVTLSELQKQVDCSANKLSITNEYALPRDINTSTNYLGDGNATIYADGGYPLSDGGDDDTDEDYEWCIENAPSWLNNNECDGTLKDCSSGFSQCTSPSLDGNPSLRGSAGVDHFRIKVKDQVNTISKSFTITIDTDTSASGSGGSTSTYSLTINNSGGNKYYSINGAGCTNIPATESGLNGGDSLKIYRSKSILPLGNCSNEIFSDTIGNLDTNGNNATQVDCSGSGSGSNCVNNDN